MMMASIVTLPVLVFTMCLGLLPIALLVVLQVFLCRKSGKLGLILPILSLLLSFALTSVALINCVTPASASSMVRMRWSVSSIAVMVSSPFVVLCVHCTCCRNAMAFRFCLVISVVLPVFSVVWWNVYA